jgi:hypothetical protein
MDTIEIEQLNILDQVTTMFYRRKFDALIRRYGNTGFASFSLLNRGRE